MTAYKLLLIMIQRRKPRIEECRNWMPEPYRITPEELEEINQLLEEMDKMEQ